MYTFLVILFVLVSILMIVVILMQSSKGGGLAGTFGGPGSSTIFGGRGVATFLSKLTTGLAVAFFVLAFLMGVINTPKEKQRSIVKEKAGQVSPAEGLSVPAGVPLQQGESPLPDQQKQAKKEKKK